MWDRGILRGVRVLFVEDDDDTRGAVTLGLHLHGAQVTAVASANEALVSLARERHDVLVSDICLPDQDGYALIRTVRSLPEAVAHIPAAAVTARGTGEDRAKALVAGFQEHLIKPVDTSRLAAVVAALAHEAVTRHPEGPPPQP